MSLMNNNTKFKEYFTEWNVYTLIVYENLKMWIY